MNELKAEIRRAAVEFQLGRIGAIDFQDQVCQAFQRIQLDQSSALADWIERITNDER